MKIQKLSFILLPFLFLLSACGSKEGTVISFDSRENNVVDIRETSEENKLDETGSDNLNSAQTVKEICVSITGAVLNPGVYYLGEGSRIYELINAAGGLLDNADTESINLVSILSDGMQVCIGNKKEAKENSDSQELYSTNIQDSGSANGLININTASLSELTTLPSIGNTRAQAIIAYRDKNHGFSSIDDIKNVSGIKEGTYEKIKDLICIK